MSAAVAPVLRALTPPVTQAPPDGFTVVTERLTTGLPHRAVLSQELQLVLVVPTGTARAWQEADPLAAVLKSDPQLSPHAVRAEAVESPQSAPGRVYVLRNEDTIGVLPLVALLARRVSRVGSSELGWKLEIVFLAWDIRAGSLRGSGDYGSFVTFAWRELGRAQDAFSAPVLPPRVLERLPLERELEPELPSVRLTPPGDVDA